MSQKYAIAKNRGLNAFFTKSSSYDRPQWVAESDASTFLTAELAETAARKLYKHGAYEARVVALQEAIEIELPDDEVDVQSPEDGDDGKMVAQVQTSAPTTPDYSTQDDSEEAVDDEDLEDLEDKLVGVEDPEMADVVVAPGGEEEPALPLTNPVRTEGVELPTRPANDPVDNGNTDTVHNIKGADKIKYNDPTDGVGAEVPQVVGDAADAVTVPPEVKSALTKAIAAYKREGELTTDDTRGEFVKTAEAAFTQLQAFLDLGNVDGLKRAQIYLQTWMNSLTTNLPQVVRDFVLTGGRKKSSLQSLFDKAWDAKRAQTYENS